MDFESTRWIQCGYTSIISFVFHLPVLLVPALHSLPDRKSDDVSGSAIKRATDTLKAAHFSRHTDRSDANFYFVQHAICVSGAKCLDEVGFVMWDAR